MSFATAYYMKAAKPIADQLLGFGLALHQVCGVLASIQGESSFQPGIKGDKGADGKFHAFDLLQLHSDRAALIKAGCGIDLLADPAPSPEDQIKAMWWELNHTEKRALAHLISTRSAYDAGYAFAQYYERPANIAKDGPKRAQYAEDWFDALSPLYPAPATPKGVSE